MGSGYLIFQPRTAAASWISYVSVDLDTQHIQVCAGMLIPKKKSFNCFEFLQVAPTPSPPPTVSKNCLRSPPRTIYHLTFLKLVVAHHIACNVTLVSRGRVASLFLPRHKGALCRPGEREWKREVCWVTIKHDPWATITRSPLESEWWNHRPAACKCDLCDVI